MLEIFHLYQMQEIVHSDLPTARAFIPTPCKSNEYSDSPLVKKEMNRSTSMKSFINDERLAAIPSAVPMPNLSPKVQSSDQCKPTLKLKIERTATTDRISGETTKASDSNNYLAAAPTTANAGQSSDKKLVSRRYKSVLELIKTRKNQVGGDKLAQMQEDSKSIPL